MREDPFLHADEEHHRELQTLRRVQGQQHHLIFDFAVGQVVGVGDERDLFEELVHHGELAGRADEFTQVLDAAVRLDRVLGFEFGQIAGPVDGRLEHVARALIGVGGDEWPRDRADRRTMRSRGWRAR